jgi:hypothetical protein
MKSVQITLSELYVTLPDTHSFCESVNAGSASLWHIRKLATHMFFGGGCDTDALCGKRVSPYGWDMPVSVGLRKTICPKCLELLEKNQ